MTVPTPITIARISRTGLDLSTVTPVAADVANGNSVVNSGNMFIAVHNTNSGSTAHIVTATLTGGKDGQTITPKSISVAATKTEYLGPWPSDIYTGVLQIQGAHAELLISAFELPRT